MALELMKACRAKNIDCIVAPYEADAQLAYFSITGIAHLIITEDSDLLTFGCTRVFFKMDHGGSGVLIEKDQLYLSLGGRAEYFNHEKFRRMCILSGCDYLPSLPGIGLGKAFKFFSRTTNDDINTTLCRVPSCLKMPNLEVTKEYRDDFVQAEQTFLYQLVYDPVSRKVVPLTPYPEDMDINTLLYAGKYLDEDVAFHLALGNLDVKNLDRIANYDPDTSKKPLSFGIWSKNFSIKTQQPPLRELALQSQETKPALCKKITTKIEFSLTKQATAQPIQMTESELTSQYIQKETSPLSPVLSRKRKRSIDSSQSVALVDFSEDSTISSNTASVIPAILDPFVQEIDCATYVVHEKKTPSKNSNPFVKLKSPPTGNCAKTPPSITSHFSALRTLSQLKTTNSQGEEIVTSSYFQTDNFSSPQASTITGKLAKTILNSDNHLIPISSTKASFQPFKPVTSSLTESRPFSLNEFSPKITKTVSGCRVAGLSRQTQKKTPSSGMRQLNLRDMFALKD